MPYTSITIIVAPYHVGIYDHRVGGGPLRILAHGIDRELEKLAPVSFINIGPVDEFEGEIGRTFEIIRRISKAVSQAAENDSFPLVLSGNCYASTAVVAGLNKFVPSLAALWLDAHDDLDTPSTHENGYLDAMAASMLTGTSWHALMKTVPGHAPMDVKNIVYCGLRDVSDTQRRTIQSAGVDVVWGDAGRKVDFESELSAVLKRRNLGKTHIHLDLDVLDESLGRVNEFPSPGGFMPEDLMGLMKIIPTETHPTSLVICSFNPRLEGGDGVAKLAVQAACRLVGSLKEKGLFASNLG
ncbi:Arginase [Metarhizium anisopliae]|nr:Arginase [Metarhizium anisopliae]